MRKVKFKKWIPWDTMFCGNIATQEDFKKVLEMVII